VDFIDLLSVGLNHEGQDCEKNIEIGYRQCFAEIGRQPFAERLLAARQFAPVDGWQFVLPGGLVFEHKGNVG
jgi:hypothetical protein